MKKIENFLCMVLTYLIYLFGIFIGGVFLYASWVLHKNVILGIVFVAVPIFFYLVYKEFRKEREIRQMKEESERNYKEWVEKIEPTLRDTKGYPEDWQNRRNEVYSRAGGVCALCAKHVEENCHVHHKVPISQGGNHDFSNFELLCEDCHIEKHPDNAVLRISSHLRKIRKLHIGADAKIRRARRGWTCASCEKEIKAGELHYGGRGYQKLCMYCYHPKM